MIISGTAMPERSTADAVIDAVRTIFGRIDALSAVVRVRARSPYIDDTSCPLVA
jgi:hypothetical protein